MMTDCYVGSEGKKSLKYDTWVSDLSNRGDGS